MDWIESKYIGLISSRLAGFKRKSASLYNFRCPICGDSKKSKTKARGWIFEKSGSVRFFCHNCGASMNLARFIQTIDPAIYTEMKLERMRGGVDSFVQKPPSMALNFRPVFEKSNALARLTRVSALHHDDPIKRYVVSRMIPPESHYRLFVADEFCKYVNGLIPGKFSDSALAADERRLVIPFIDSKSKVHALQGRSLNDRSLTRYITIVLDDSVPKIFGLDTLKPGKTYVVEGPIDSLFLKNSIATAGGDLMLAASVVDRNDMVIVYDNERRSKETVDKMKKAIRQGFKVCFWPENILYKDVNDMVKYATMSGDQIARVIDENTHVGLKAEMELSRWKRVAN